VLKAKGDRSAAVCHGKSGAAKGTLKKCSEKKDAMGMKLMKREWLRIGRGIVVSALAILPAAMAMAQAVSTTTVQGTVYLANGQPGAGTLLISWPAFTTAAGQAVAADSITVTIGVDGFLSVNLAPNLGATPAGEFYTAVYDMSDGTTSTQYWVIPAAAQASLAQVQAQVMPAAQAVQAVSKAYVDQAIAELSESSGLSASGGTLTGPLILSGDPTQPLQAADKHYVDTQVATAVPLAGGNMTGALTTPAVNGVQAPAVESAQTTLQAAMNAAGTNGAMVIPPTYAGTDTFTNANGVKVTDLRSAGAQQAERSVKEFGAVCDGVTDDTNALQAALSYANAHGVALTIPQGTCKTRTLSWHGESIGGLGKQVSALMGFPGQDVLQSGPDATNMLSYTRLHDLTIYVDQSVDVSCSPAEGRAAAGSCQLNRPMEANSIFSPGGNGLTGAAGAGAAWSVGNCAIAMQAATGAGGNGLRVAEMENVEIATTGADPMAAQYPGAHSTHACGLYLAQWPQWSEFRNIDIRGLNTGVAIPALPTTAPAGLNADSNRWENVTIQATHTFTAAAGSNNVLDNVVALAGNSSATDEPPTGLVLDLNGTAQGWTVRNAVVVPAWNAVPASLTVTAAGGAVTAVTLGSEHGLGWDPYGVSVPVAFSGSCTAQATAAVNANGAISGITLTQGGVGCSATTTASLNAAGAWDTAAPVNLIGGQNMTFFAGNLLKGNGGYTVWNAGSSASYGTQLDSGGGLLPGGGTYAAMVGSSRVGSAYQVDQFPGADIGAKIQACVNAVNATYGGTCDARNFTGNLTMGSNLTISTGNVAILLPCATIATANQIVVTAGSRNVALRGCALRGGSEVSGSTGGTALAYTGSGAMLVVGDSTYVTDTPGFHLDNVVINTTQATSATAQGLIAYRTQELDLESLYFLGNSNQTGMTLDGTGNYTGGTFLDNEFSGFGTAVNAIGHQVTNPATTDWMNASTFVRLHIDCPTSGGNPISGTYGINLQQGDGNTFTGGDVEGCATALHLGPNAQNNTIVGLRNENSTSQVIADAGSAYNNWMTGGTMFTGKLTDNGTRNSFLDTFHRSFNALNGDWYLSQQDATLTNHFRLGIGAGNERGLLNEIQTDYGYRWLYGFSDAAGGQQLYQMDDLLNNVYRLQIQQWNPGQSSTNNETALNAAGTGNVCFNCSTNSGTGGVTFASGGTTPTAVGTVDKLGDAQFVGNLLVGGTTQSAGTLSLRNSADAEVDYYLWPGLTTSQKGSFTYKDWNGNSQWYLVKDASNNWALNSATGGLDSFKAYQSTNTGDTYIDASNSTGHVRFNYETGSGTETDIYSGSSTNLDAAFLAPNAIKFPGLAASSGDFCLQIDDSGWRLYT
jgi:Pectate lyase superfamily protein